MEQDKAMMEDEEFIREVYHKREIDHSVMDLKRAEDMLYDYRNFFITLIVPSNMTPELFTELWNKEREEDPKEQAKDNFVFWATEYWAHRNPSDLLAVGQYWGKLTVYYDKGMPEELENIMDRIVESLGA